MIEAIPKRFALLGAAGFIAPSHFSAIHRTGNKLVLACDPHDSVQRIDAFFPSAEFVTEEELFLSSLKKNPVDYVSICTPDYLHKKHISLALDCRSHAICEKPLITQPSDLDNLAALEQLSGKNIYAIQQLRYHKAVRDLKLSYPNPPTTKTKITIAYISHRGPWYLNSWRASPEKAGGLVMDIGIHFFDILLWIFGSVEKSTVNFLTPTKGSGNLELEGASVKWFLSIDARDLPRKTDNRGLESRSLTIDGEEIELSGEFHSLHTLAYQDILEGRGIRLGDITPLLRLTHCIQYSRDLNSDLRSVF
jgi:UDP-N-acetyl-2-amino-2-deoxyglucuronate dehydrogenase